jgi:ribosomal protein L16 Arg81 hydroxylase
VPALERCVSVTPAVFGREYWAVQPLHSPAESLPGDFSDLFSAAAADELLADRALRTPFIRMAMEGTVLPPERYTASGGFGAQVADQVDSAMVLREFADGATIVLQGLHRTWPAIQAFTRRLVQELGHPVQVNAYITPESSRGFDSHYDVHDVFVLQVTGEKHWRVHAPVLAHPRADEPWSRHRDAVAARAKEEPMLDVVMRPGDVLYLPRGWLHSATARQGTTIHLTVGVAAFTGADVVREMVAAVSGSATLRAPLPIMGSAADGTDLETVVQDVTVAFLATLTGSPDVTPSRTAEALRRKRRQMVRPEPVAPLATIDTASGLDGAVVVRLRDGLDARVRVDSGGVHLATPGKGLRLPLTCEAAIRAMARRERLRAGALPGLDEADSLVVTRRLLRSGLLVIEHLD